MSNNKSHHNGTLSPEMALLGLLYHQQGYGYDLHRKVSTDLEYVWHLSQSRAYAILKHLEMGGDISMEEIPQDKLPPRQMFHMTEQGRNRFLNWLDAPSGGSVRLIRMEFITRLYFLRMYMPEMLAQLFDRQRVEVTRQLRRLENTCDMLPPVQIYNIMSLKMRMKQLRAVLEWLDECHQQFQ